jgi:hypothetical protein
LVFAIAVQVNPPFEEESHLRIVPKYPDTVNVPVPEFGQAVVRAGDIVPPKGAGVRVSVLVETASGHVVLPKAVNVNVTLPAVLSAELGV